MSPDRPCENIQVRGVEVEVPAARITTTTPVIITPLTTAPRPSTATVPASPWPVDLRAAGECAILAAGEALSGTSSTRSLRRRALRTILAWLATAPGHTWQDRWELLGATAEWERLRPGKDTPKQHLAWATGVDALVSLGALTPGWDWFLRVKPSRVSTLGLEADAACWDAVRQVMGDLGLTELRAHAVERGLSTLSLQLRKGLASITPADVVEYGRRRDARRHVSGAIRLITPPEILYKVLQEAELLPPSAPADFRLLTYERRTVADVVAGYRFRTGWFGALLQMYLEDNITSGGDFSSAKTDAQAISVFWRAVEAHDPQPESLALSEAAWATVRATMQRRQNGDERVAYLACLVQVRCFYATVAERSHDDLRYAPFVARCPIRKIDTGGVAEHKQNRKAVKDARTRDLTPLLPALRRFALERTVALSAMLGAAQDTKDGDTLSFADQTWTVRRTLTGNVLLDDGSGQRHFLSRLEENAFWGWALLETLNCVGPRIEEVLELTDYSVVLFQASKGKVPLLHIAPSKTNQERLVPINQDLLTVIKQIRRRHKAATGGTPINVRYDPHEEVLSPALPYLFQATRNQVQSVFSPQTAREMLATIVAESGLTLRDGSQPSLQPHDLRRLFATRAVNTGLPVHVVAAILGHKNLETTRGYITTFDEQSMDAYFRWIDHLRQQRPASEYETAPSPTLENAVDFLTDRKVQGGRCTRTFGTECVVGHNCRRCPLLDLGPDARPQLNEMQQDSHNRLARAQLEGWSAEVAGHELDVLAIQAKQADLDLRDAAQALLPLADDISDH